MIDNAYLAKAILQDPESREWSIQGLGMLRTYLAPEVRLHVWDSRYRAPDVSTMHNHPWHFHSTVLAGVVRNTRFTVGSGAPYMRQLIQCGSGGHEVGEPEEVELWGGLNEVYNEGASYSQFAHEVHVSEPEDGTVTLVRRELLDDTEHACVFYPRGMKWVSAEPRVAALEEVLDICGSALERWFS